MWEACRGSECPFRLQQSVYEVFLEVRSVSFDYRRACWKLIRVCIVAFYYRRGWELLDLRGIHFDYPKSCWGLVEVCIVGFDYDKACWGLVELR